MCVDIDVYIYVFAYTMAQPEKAKYRVWVSGFAQCSPCMVRRTEVECAALQRFGFWGFGLRV